MSGLRSVRGPLGMYVLYVEINQAEEGRKAGFRYCWTPGARAFAQTGPAFLLAPAKLQKVIIGCCIGQESHQRGGSDTIWRLERILL